MHKTILLLKILKSQVLVGIYAHGNHPSFKLSGIFKYNNKGHYFLSLYILFFIMPEMLSLSYNLFAVVRAENSCFIKYCWRCSQAKAPNGGEYHLLIMAGKYVYWFLGVGWKTKHQEPEEQENSSLKG